MNDPTRLDILIGNVEAELYGLGGRVNLKRYNKLWVGLAALIAGIVGANVAGADVDLIESAILLVLTGLGIYAPRNDDGATPVRSQSTARTPWWVVCMLVPLMLLGCASTDFNDTLGAAYLTRTTIAESITDECGNTVPDGPCAPESAISTEVKQDIKKSLQRAGSLLADARAINAGRAGVDCSDKWECLEAANGVLDAVERILEERQ